MVFAKDIPVGARNADGTFTLDKEFVDASQKAVDEILAIGKQNKDALDQILSPEQYDKLLDAQRALTIASRTESAPASLTVRTLSHIAVALMYLRSGFAPGFTRETIRAGLPATRLEESKAFFEAIDAAIEDGLAQPNARMKLNDLIQGIMSNPGVAPFFVASPTSEILDKKE